MAKHDWIYDLMQTHVYEGKGRARRVNIQKVYAVATANGGDETVEKMQNIKNLTAGQATAILSSLLRGVARRNKGVNVPNKNGGVDFCSAPEDWLSHYGIAA